MIYFILKFIFTYFVIKLIFFAIFKFDRHAHRIIQLEMADKTDFKTVLKIEISNNGKFRKYLTLLEVIDEGLKYYVDIRLFYIGDLLEKPTRTGVCLTRNEFASLLPYLLERKQHEIDGNRKVSLIQTNRGWLYDLKLIKCDGKETNITLTTKEIDKIIKYKDEIFKNCY